MTAILEVEDLRAGYGAQPVLQGVSFSVREGETAVILGLNGAGKTTTVSAVCGLVKPWSGSVVFDGTPITGRSPAQLVGQGIVLVPEGRRCFPDLTVVQNLRMGSWVRRKRKAEVAETMERVMHYFPRLEERRDQLAGLMSGGEQQMLAIGRGLMAGPRLLMIDEASLGLAPVIVNVVFDVVDQIKADGTTVVLIEQNVGALAHADRALLMEKGAVIEEVVGDALRDTARLRAVYLGQ